MIVCTCGRQLAVTCILSLTRSPSATSAALYSLATHLGWIELNPGSWACPGCMRAERRCRTAS